MSKIKIKNFGPIKEDNQKDDGWIDIKKVTVFIGNQGSGKSTVAKVISTMTWLEKAINRGDIDRKKISQAKFEEFFQYQRIENYFRHETEIEYTGKRLKIRYSKKISPPEITIEEKSSYLVPKIMYIPSERNFLSTISDAYDTKGLPDNIFTFAEELKKAQKEFSGNKLQLPLSNYSYEYDENKDSSYILGTDYRLNLLEASSGIQSLVPLFLVYRNLAKSISEEEETLRKNLSVTQSIRMDNEIAKLMLTKTFLDSEIENEINKIRARYYNKCFYNIVEEPEQNLFPSSQWIMLKSLLKFNNKNIDNKLIITTHSPYLINCLTLAVKAATLKENINIDFPKLVHIVPVNSMVDPEDLVIYELDEKNGTIKMLGNYNGIPSDENFLNEFLGEGNRLYDKLLEIEEGL